MKKKGVDAIKDHLISSADDDIQTIDSLLSLLPPPYLLLLPHGQVS